MQSKNKRGRGFGISKPCASGGVLVPCGASQSEVYSGGVGREGRFSWVQIDWLAAQWLNDEIKTCNLFCETIYL